MTTAIRQRFRVRFSKQDDLRLIGHRDLLRTMQRLLRRAGMNLSMTEGFHPKPRLSFPAPLAVGIVGADEVMELELAEDLSAEEVLAAIQPHCPPGLRFLAVDRMPSPSKKAAMSAATYEIAVPEERRGALANEVDRLASAATIPVERPDRKEPLDLAPQLDGVELDEDVLRFRLRTIATAGVRPREVLAALGMGDLEEQGRLLTRTQVALDD